jgi:hypothetical protein
MLLLVFCILIAGASVVYALSREKGGRMNNVFGGVLMAIGILIASASGLCSLSVLFGTGEFAGGGMWLMVLIIGGIPFALGAGMTYGGWRLIRNSRPKQPKPKELSETFE